MFWRLTIFGLFREFVVGLRIKRDEFMRDTRIGYQAIGIWIATQNKNGHMPKFETLVAGPKVPQSVEQMKSALQLMSQQTGVALQKLKKQRVH